MNRQVKAALGLVYGGNRRREREPVESIVEGRKKGES
jgi:hypothetical protein